MKPEHSKYDTKELELPDTTFSRNIDNRVFQGIILQCLSTIEGISLVGPNFIDNIFGRTGPEGVIAEQDSQGVNIQIEVNIAYGSVIPAKAEEIQTKVVEEITNLTGLHVSSIHIAFKNILPPEQLKKDDEPAKEVPDEEPRTYEEDYNEDF